MDEEAWKKFYDENPPPSSLLDIKLTITKFIEYHICFGNKVVLITSGGTSVPLEHSTVRFVDNFSAGNRGAASAEYFLKAGYAVIFMHRTKTLEPYVRHINATQLVESCHTSGDNESNIIVEGDICNSLIPIIHEHKRIQQQKLLLKINFTTLSSYLHMLYIAAQALRPMGKDAILYLAAAVSDFYIPEKDMAVHKISSDAPLNLTLRVVPKMLQPLVCHWIPEAFVVSFKLETDTSILLKKAKGALEKYGHNLVIANELHSRKEKVVFVTKDDERVIKITEEDVTNGKEIEEIIVQELLVLYSQFLKL